MERMTLDPAIGALITAAVALLFASAGVHKLRDLKGFDAIFSAYGLMPIVSRTRITWVVPMLEMSVAAGLSVKISRPFAAALAMVLLSGYAAAIAINLKRGRRDLACGCGGPDERRTIAPWMVWRNGLIVLGAALVFVPWSNRPLGVWDAITVAFGVMTVALLYLCIDQLLGNAQRTAQMWGSR